jgi:hypothetical protein
MVDGAQAKPSRYERGIANPDPVKLAALRALIEADPSTSKAELSRRLGISRASVGYYVRAIAAEVAQAKGEAVSRRALSHIDLVQRVAATADEVRDEIARVRASKANPTAIFAGYRTLVQVERLLAELLGEVQPAANVYLQRVEVLLSTPVDAGTLSPALRAALGDTEQR